MVAVGRRLNVRLFLEGVEVPVIGHVIASQKNAAATCSIQILANDYAMDLKPRTLVHIFEYDPYAASPAVASSGITGNGIRVIQQDVDPEAQIIPPVRMDRSATKATQEDLENQNYRLTFCGELVGFGFNKTPRTRSITLHCLDLSNYWDQVYQYQMSGYSFGHGGLKAAFTGVSTKVFSDFLKGTGDIVTEMLETAPRGNPALKGTLLGGLTNLIQRVGGVYYGKRAIRGTNDFFSVAEMRLHLSQMIGSNPYAADEVRLLRRRGFGSIFRRNIAGLGKQISIRGILLALQKYIFHEIVPITAPRYIPAATTSVSSLVPATLREVPETLSIHNTLVKIKGGFQQMKSAQSSDQEFGRDDLNLHDTSILLEIQSLASNTKTTIDSLNAEGNVNIGKEIKSALSTAESSAKEMYQLTQGANHLVPISGPDAQRFGTKADAALERIKTALATDIERAVQTGNKQGDPPARLLSQLYKPDIWMVAPPRCNVLFPEQYMNFSYSRSYLAEVSRLLLRTHSAWLGSDYLFDGYYTTPNSLLGARTGKNQARGKTNKAPDDIDSPAFWRRDLMDHELYTGIIPKFERMSDLNLHAIRGGHFRSGGVKIPYAALAANHIFFQYRFRSRQLQVAARYNPFVVLGFPMLIIDKHDSYDYTREIDKLAADNIAAAGVNSTFGGPADLDNFEARETLYEDIYDAVIKSRENTHFLGTPMSIQHAVSAMSSSGATTQINLEYARTTNERTEFLGDNMSMSPKKANRRINTEVAALEEPKVGGVGPTGGSIVEVTDVTDKYARRTRKRTRPQLNATGTASNLIGKKLPLYSGATIAGRVRQRDDTVLVGVEQPASAYNSAQVIALVGSTGRNQATDTSTGSILVEFGAYRVVEEHTVRERKIVTICPEDLTFPPWLGNEYRSKGVGGIYSFYFGTGAITDPTSFTFPAGSKTLSAKATDSANPAEAVVGADAGSPGPADSGGVVSRTDEVVTLDDPATPAEVQEAGGRHPVRKAVDELVKAYSRVRLEGHDVDEFIKTYTWRPIASLPDILGSADLVISDEGSVESGYEGFHSRAFGNYDDLRTLVDQNAAGPKTILGVDVKDPSDADATTIKRNQRISEALDTRKEKRQAVLRYLHAVMAQRGIL